MINKIKKIFSKTSYSKQERRINTESQRDYPSNVAKIINLMNYTKSNDVSYSASKFDVGYHTIELGDYKFNGQRQPLERFEKLPVSLSGKTVLDIGCNQGGMLHAFSDIIKSGIGIDYDFKMVNAANRIAMHKNDSHLNFFVFNLDEEDYDRIKDFLPTDKIDTVFLLSVCMWIKNWKGLISFVHEISKELVFESNGKPEQQVEQEEYLKKVYNNVVLVTERSEDDASQKNRKLFYCS